MIAGKIRTKTCGSTMWNWPSRGVTSLVTAIPSLHITKNMHYHVELIPASGWIWGCLRKESRVDVRKRAWFEESGVDGMELGLEGGMEPQDDGAGT